MKKLKYIKGKNEQQKYIKGKNVEQLETIKDYEKSFHNSSLWKD